MEGGMEKARGLSVIAISLASCVSGVVWVCIFKNGKGKEKKG